MQQMFTALERGNTNAGGGYIEQGEQQFMIRGIGLLRSPDDIGNIVVAEQQRRAGAGPRHRRRDDRRRAASGPGRAWTTRTISSPASS